MTRIVARTSRIYLFLVAALAHLSDGEELAAVGGQVAADLDVELL